MENKQTNEGNLVKVIRNYWNCAWLHENITMMKLTIIDWII